MSKLTLSPLFRSLAVLALGLPLAACAGTRGAVGVDRSTRVQSEFEVLGASTEGRPVRARTVSARGPRVTVIAGIHGDEPEGLRHLDELVEWLAKAPATVRVIEDVNPDGSVHGTRATVNGVDPNRNWPASNFTPDESRGPAPLSEPSVRAAHDDLVRFAPELVIVLHSSRRGPFVNYDGPAAELAETFATAAGAPWHVVPDMGYPTPGSFGSWMGRDRNVPTLTIELLRGDAASATGPALERGLAATIAQFVAERGAAKP